MKKKVYFIISAVIQIIIALYVIVLADSIVQNEIQAFKELYDTIPIDMIKSMIENIERNGVNSIRICSSMCMAINIGVIITAIKNNILRNKGLLITGSIICLLFAGNQIVEILAIVNIIVLIVLKRKNPEDFPIKMEIPKLEEIAITKKEIFLCCTSG